jgi:cell wall-associated NlpC family hydrolase
MKKIAAAALALFLIAPAAMPTPSHAATYETNVERGVNFRAQPSTSSYIYRMIPKGEDIHVIEKTNNYWLKIKVQDGTTGYISAQSQYTDYKGSSSGSSGGSSNTSNASKADKIISLAKNLTSKVTYNYGTRNPSKYIFDCSSFTEYVFEQNGVSLPWGTKTQKNVGKAVSKSNLKKGDLVFFSTSGSTIDHVGIYIGSGQFIHNTPSKNGISINNLNSGYWSREYESARRVL